MPGFDAIASGFGGETSDSLVVNVSSKPVWRLKPLPLSQVNPDHAEAPARVGPPPSLQTSCLDTISTYFHDYTPDALAGLPPAHVQRIIAKARSDRLHPELDISYRPDEATVWVYSVLADPEGTEQDMTLGLHPTTLLRQLPPNQALNPPDHPFIQLPKLYASLQPDTTFTLMTTLKLDGAAKHVRDDSIMALRYATNLTVLTLRDCDEVSDSAVRLLSSGLILPGERGGDGAGMWRLRAWFMHGCTRISDKSMRSLARWPGLVALVFNKASQDLYACQLANMQPVNTSLRQLFAMQAAPSSILAGLNATLLANPSTQYRALHLVPHYDTLAPADLPEPPTLQNTKATGRSGTAFRTGGIGQIYGTDVTSVADEDSAFRGRVQVALTMQAMDEGLIPDYRDMTYKETREQLEKEERKKERDRKKLTKGYGGQNIKKAPVRAKKGMQAEAEVVKGEAPLMLVRVGQEGWDRMTWSTASREQKGSAMPTISTQRAERKGDLVGDILGLMLPRSQNSQSVPLASQRADIKPDLPPAPFSQAVPTPTPRANPFAFARKTATGTPTSASQSSETRVTSSSPELLSRFDSSQASTKKRRFGGAEATQGEAKRRGMKMFTRS